MKKFIKLFLMMVVTGIVLFQVACGGNSEKDIFVVAREQGSGTRGAFEEIIGLSDDLTYGSELSSTGAVTSAVSTNKDAIGYISLGSVNDTVKAVKIGKVAATAANVADGAYKIARPFLVVHKANLTEFQQDFKTFLASSQAQTIIKSEKYVDIVASPATYTAKYTAVSTPTGTITISGSTSVTPLMEKLVAKYKELNAITSNTSITVQGNSSGEGITAAKDGISVFGMASRELKDSEKPNFTNAAGASITLCKDGIAVIVHKENKLDDLTLAQVKDIYESKIKKFSAVTSN